MVIKKYSKNSSFYLKTKKDFFSENSNLLKRAKEQNKLYKSQPVRKLCKLCQEELDENIDFVSHEIEYKFCSKCSHLNGNYEDTKSFVQKLYSFEEGSDYSENYIDKDFKQRSEDIYSPKVKFLLETLNKKDIGVLDIGCGSGYFVYSSLKNGLLAEGIDVNKTMINFGNHQINHLLKKMPLRFSTEEEFYESIVNTKFEVISVIGVIEHLRKPQKFFESFRESKATYLYYSVPMFSFSVILENIFKEVFPRQLSGAHTHLFTESSLKKMHSLIGVKSLAEWRFGTDMMDLYRTFNTSLKINKVSENLIKNFEENFLSELDELQSIFDENHFCSEIHCIAAKE